MRSHLTRLAPCEVVQLTGALSRPDVDESSVDLVRDVARISEGPAYFFYAPMFVPDAATARVMRTQPEVARAIARFEHVTKAVVGLGAWQAGLSTVADAVTDAERQQMYEQGVRAELCGDPARRARRGHDHRAERAPGRHQRRAAARGARGDRDRLRHREGGAPSGPALRGGLVNSLVTHTAMAAALLAEP